MPGEYSLPQMKYLIFSYFYRKVIKKKSNGANKTITILHRKLLQDFLKVQMQNKRQSYFQSLVIYNNTIGRSSRSAVQGPSIHI